MPGKVQLDKAAWQWVDEIQDPQDVSPTHVDIAYRLNLAACPKGVCRRNCKGNPFCLTGLGEKAWFKELDERQWHDFDPESERREEDDKHTGKPFVLHHINWALRRSDSHLMPQSPHTIPLRWRSPEGKFVGLKNLGATCYVNTFIQLWFHNPAVRQAVYQWRSFDECFGTDTDWKPTSICGHLQLLFGLLQYSKRAYIDPSPLIESLGLDTREQQDAQEFSKLFLSVLEGALLQRSLNTSNIIQQQFAGIYCYVTKCKTCGSESSREATFYELDINIQGHSALMVALQEFLKEEKLEGENQYMCSVCDSKQNAVRSIRLQTLPPVLNLQLLRFVFDVKKGYKKKLNSYLQFYDTLDMSPFLGKPAGTLVYELTAVLIHRGPSAHSGHYIAHIQDADSKLWFRFNDSDITAMKGKKLQLGKEDDVISSDLPEINGSPSPKAPRNPKGQHSSRDAYMLVYRRKEADSEAAKPSCSVKDMASSGLPDAVKAYIDRDNASFENWIQEIALTRDANIFSGKEKQKLVQTMYTALECSSAEEFEWIPADWLSSWLSEPDKAPSISCAKYLCTHQRLHPDDVVKMKIVSVTGADKLYEDYGGDTRLKGREAVCVECVRQRCQELQLKDKLAEHSRFLTAELKKPVDQEQSYWVGKTSLRSWKQYAMDQINSVNGNTSSSRANEEDRMDVVDGNEKEETVNKMEENGDGDKGQQDKDKDTDSESLHDTFNSDLLCDQHGALHPNENCRRLVSETVWKRFRCLFPDCPQFHKDDPVCPQCEINMTKEREAKKQCRELYASQREQLQDLYLDRNRPKLKEVSGAQVFVISSAFLYSWRKLIKNREGSNAGEPLEIVNKPLLCEHNQLLYHIPLDKDQANEQILSLIWGEEWKQLTNYYSFDVAVQVLTAVTEDGQLSVFTSPEICDECMARRLQEEEDNQFTFEDATIFVRKVVPSLSAIVAESESAMEEDPDFVETKQGADTDGPVAKKPRPSENKTVRKSHRHRKQRGEKEIKVSSHMTLKEFKTKVMYEFSIPTFDQNLSLDGRPITNSELTLGQLRFYPGCIIILKADEPNQETVADMENLTARKPEEGFKGTNLMSS